MIGVNAKFIGTAISGVIVQGAAALSAALGIGDLDPATVAWIQMAVMAIVTYMVPNKAA